MGCLHQYAIERVYYTYTVHVKRSPGYGKAKSPDRDKEVLDGYIRN